MDFVQERAGRIVAHVTVTDKPVDHVRIIVWQFDPFGQCFLYTELV
jgi:hypothetical protein